MYIPARGSGAPTHTAPRGALYYRTSNDTVYIQTAGATGSTWVVLGPGGSGDLLAANNLSDLVSASTARSNLGLGSLATANTISDDNWSGADLAITNGGSGQSTAAAALAAFINGSGSTTSIAHDDLLGIVDATGEKITYGNFIGSGKAVVVKYTGSGSSGKTVTLTGINRCHFLVLINTSNSGTVLHYEGVPAGATGTIQYGRFTNGNADNTLSLSAPAAGTAQVLTINNTITNLNASGQAYHVFAVGTPT